MAQLDQLGQIVSLARIGRYLPHLSPAANIELHIFKIYMLGYVVV